MKVLLVEDNAADARMVREMVFESESKDLDLVTVQRLHEAIGRLRTDSFDAVLLDLGLPDAQGIEALEKLQCAAPNVPIVVLSGLHDETVAVEAVRRGAQDYLLKARSDAVTLTRAIRYATERKRAELEIRHLAHHDSLTDLPNRALLLDRLAHALARTQREKKLLAVLFVDLDNFKVINDTRGHAAGDELLRSVSSRLSSCMRESDTVARLGGDEFALVLPEVSHVDDVSRFAAKVLDAFKRPFTIGGRDEHVTTSIGISLYPADGDDAATLLNVADAAMYRAKQDGGELYHFHSEKSELMESERLPLENRLGFALEAHELLLYYQPRIDARSGKIVGVEALLRWQHPVWGLLQPSSFVPLAEEMGLIVPIGKWVLMRACAQVESWNRSRGVPLLHVSVNLSSRQFNHRNLCHFVEHALRETGLPPECLELELTEGGMMLDERAAMVSLRELNAVGVRISIDDFGTGYSSLSRLRRFPVHCLKVDRSFVEDIDGNPRDAAMVSAIVTMAHSMQMKVVAEGVERIEQVTALRERDCDEMQGYYFGRPRPADELLGLLGDLPRWETAEVHRRPS